MKTNIMLKMFNNGLLARCMKYASFSMLPSLTFSFNTVIAYSNAQPEYRGKPREYYSVKR